jgi:hypothetical protein
MPDNAQKEIVLLQRHPGTSARINEDGSRGTGNGAARRRGVRSARVAAVAVTLMAGAALAAAPQARADGGLGDIPVAAFASNAPTPQLFNLIGAPHAQDRLFNNQLAMMPGTSPAIGAFPTFGHYQVAYVGLNGDLFLNGDQGHGDTTWAVMPGTSPSITITSNGNYEVAFQGRNGDLWTLQPGLAATDWGFLGAKLDPGSSPSITAEPGNQTEIAFEQQGTDTLSLFGNGFTQTTEQMQPRTSPSIATPAGGGFQYEVAFQAKDTALTEYGTSATGSTGLGMDPASSPAITTVSANGGFEVAFEANTDILWVTGTADGYPTGAAMMKGTSPSISGVNSCGPALAGYDIAFQAADGTIRLGSGQTGHGRAGFGQELFGQGMTSSPSLTTYGTC